jgi:hypothetical protein
MNNAGQTIADFDMVQAKSNAPLNRAELMQRPRQLSLAEKAQWIAELAALRKECHTGKTGATADQILEEIRADRP